MIGILTLADDIVSINANDELSTFITPDGNVYVDGDELMT